MSRMRKSNGKPKKPDARKISRKLKPKQRKFIAYYTDPTKDTFGNATRSAIAAGYSEKSARFIASENLTKPNIQSEIAGVMDAAGATREQCGRVVHEGMDAHETKVFLNKKTGRLVYSKALVDHANRLRAAELRAKLGGDMPTSRTIERIESLRIQNTLIVVPPVEPARDRRERPVRQLTD